jgi:hypothetical protein
MLLNVKQEGNHVASTSLEKITRSVHGSAAHGAQLLRRRDAGSPKQQEARCCSSSRPRTHCPGVRVQRHAHRPLLPLARRALRSEVIIDRGGRSGGRRREAEERPGMLIKSAGTSRTAAVQDLDPELLHHLQVWAATHHESQ